MQKNLIAIVAGIIGVLVLVHVQFRSGGPRRTKVDKAESVVWRMFETARQGDVEGYLDCFTGALSSKLSRTCEEMGRREFKQYLLRLGEPILGIALSDRERVKKGVWRMRVELTFLKYNEVQFVGVHRVGNAWQVAEMTEARRIKPPVPYGTKVFE